MSIDIPMRILTVVLVLGFSMLGSAGPFPSVAHADDAQRAKELFEEGTRYFDLGQFDKAIDAWQAGYREKADPRFLYNIAQAYRLAGDASKAIFFYKGYLRNAPKASNRAEVEQKIQALQKQAAEDPNKTSGRATAPAGSSAGTGDAARATVAPPPPPPPAAPPIATNLPLAPPAPPASASVSTEPPPPGLAASPEPMPTVTQPAAEPSPLETLRPLDLGAAIGVDGWSSGVQGKAD